MSRTPHFSLGSEGMGTTSPDSPSQRLPKLVLPDGESTAGSIDNAGQTNPQIDLLKVEEELMQMMSIPEKFLSKEEDEIIEEFCGDVARIRRLNDHDATREYAVKFLMARKFNPSRAFSLYQRYKMVRHKYNMDKLQPDVDPLYSELASGKFTFLEGIENGEAIGIFTGALHTRDQDMTLFIQGLLFNIDEALRSFAAVACGITLMINLKGMKPTRDDRVTAETILTLLQDQYPARIKHVFVIDAPWYMRRIFQFLSPFLKNKMKERVIMVKQSALLNHFPRQTLPVALGGTRIVNHATWLNQAINHYMYMKGSRPYASNNATLAFQRNFLMEGDVNGGPKSLSAMYGQSPTTMAKMRSPSLPNQSGDGSVGIAVSVTGTGTPAKNKALRGVVDPVGYLRALHLMNGMPLDAIADFLDPKEYKSLFEEFSEIQAAPLHGSFLSTLLECNCSKNRYADIFCMEDTRVKLSPIYKPNGDYTDGSDYIHANYVSGLHQPKSYVLAQSPLDATVGDFWRMIWEQDIRVVVMLSGPQEHSKCARYWPDANSVVRIADFTFRLSEAVEKKGWWRRTISIRRSSERTSRQITQYHLTTWTEKGSVQTSFPMIQVMLDMHRINDVQRNAMKFGSNLSTDSDSARITCKSLPDSSMLDSPQDNRVSMDEPTNKRAMFPPILVHCSSGVGRSSAFVAADIACIALMQGTVDVPGTVCFLRTQRAQSVQTLAHYRFIYQTVLEYGFLLQEAETDATLWELLLKDMPSSHSTLWMSKANDSVVATVSSTHVVSSRRESWMDVRSNTSACTLSRRASAPAVSDGFQRVKSKNSILSVELAQRALSSTASAEVVEASSNGQLQSAEESTEADAPGVKSQSTADSETDDTFRKPSESTSLPGMDNADEAVFAHPEES